MSHFTTPRRVRSNHPDASPRASFLPGYGREGIDHHRRDDDDRPSQCRPESLPEPTPEPERFRLTLDSTGG